MSAGGRPAAAGVAAGGAQVRLLGLFRAALVVLLAGNLVRLPGLTSGAREAPVSVNDLAVATVLALGGFAAAQARRLVLDGVARRALLFAAVGGASAALAVPRFGLSGAELAFSLAYLARWLLYFGVYVVAINGLRRRDVPALVRAMERVIVAFAAFGVVQSIFLPGFAQLVYPDSAVYLDWDPQGHRLVSTFLDPNFAGALIAIGLLLAVARVSCGAPGLAPRLVLLSVALVLTASRSSMLATLVGLVVVAAALGVSRRVVRVATALGVCALAASPAILSFARDYGKLAIDASALQRVVAWGRALRILVDHPVIGVGFNTYGFVQRAYGGEAGRAAFNYSLDGGLLFVAVMTGLVGLAVYSGMIRRVVRAARGVWRSTAADGEERAVAVGCVAATVALIVHSVFVNSLLHPFLMEPVWLLWAGTAVLDRAVRSDAPGAVASS